MFMYLVFSTESINRSDESLYSGPSKNPSSSTSSLTVGMTNHLSASNPDISTLTLDEPKDIPDLVIKVFRADQSFKYLPIHKVSTCIKNKNLEPNVTVGVHKFGILMVKL